MNVQIDVHQERTVVAGPLYRVSTAVTYVYGIDSCVFVFDVETDEFSHVATVWDIVNVTNDKVIAQVNLEEFYRKSAVVIDYADQVTAVDAAAYTLERVESLAHFYNLMDTEFVGEEDHTYLEP